MKQKSLGNQLTEVDVGHESLVEEGDPVDDGPEPAIRGDEVVDGLRVRLQVLLQPR